MPRNRTQTNHVLSEVEGTDEHCFFLSAFICVYPRPIARLEMIGLYEETSDGTTSNLCT